MKWRMAVSLTVWSSDGTAAQATFRADTQLVSILATVTDRDTRLVPGLSVENFEVMDNGRLQPLPFFSDDVEPITVVVVIDTSIGMTLATDRVREVAEQFIIRLLPGDQARLCDWRWTTTNLGDLPDWRLQTGD